MARLCRERNIALRPHAKTHKSVRVAKSQIAAGAVGLCVATLREADVMVAAGIPGVHVTTPIVGPLRLEVLASLLARGGGLSVVVDDMDNLKQLEACVKRSGKTLPVIVDLDLGGMRRTGVAKAQDAVELAGAIAQSDVLEYAGIQYYSGIVQHIASVTDPARTYDLELERLAAVIRELGAAGLPPRIVTGGGTGTLDLDARCGLFSENQAGSYVFMDVEYMQVDLLLSLARPFEPALFVQATVNSNNARGLVTVDVGTKSFATDGPRPRLVIGAPALNAYEYFGDEFGMVLFRELGERVGAHKRRRETTDGEGSMYQLFHELFDDVHEEPKQLELGAKVELAAPHCDPTVNLHDYYHCVRGDTLVDIWPVDARGPL